MKKVMNITVFVTNMCNLSCHYCYEHEKSQDIMEASTVHQLVEYIKDIFNKRSITLLTLSFHGGEPLLAKDVILMIMKQLKEVSEDIEIQYRMTTNAFVEICKDIETIVRNLHELSVSIDGQKTTHDKNRLDHAFRGTYDFCTQNIKKLLLIRRDIIARMTVTPDTVNEVFNNIKHLYHLGFCNIETELDFTSDQWHNSHIEEYSEQMKKVAKFKVYLKQEGENLEIPLVKHAYTKTKNSPCNGGDTSLTIGTSGYIYPCLMVVDMPEWQLGHVKDSDSMINNERILALNDITNQGCEGCARLDYCGNSRCKLINWVSTGDYHKPNPVVCAVESVGVELGRYYKGLIE